jgi:hypothetical protein
VAGGVLAVALLAGAVRVLPLLLAPGVPLRLAPVLARGVAAVALEAALFVAPPIGWALAASRLVERGEARALFAMGVSPLGIVRRGWPAVLAVIAAAALSAGLWGREARAPGRAVRDLLAEARVACLTAPPPAVAEVPLVGLSWICLPGEAPRAVGAAPVPPAGLGAPGGAFAAATITVSDDLASLQATELLLVLPGAAGAGEARLHAASASIRGLAPAGRASNLSVAARVLVLSLSAAALAAAAAAAVLLGAIGGRFSAAALGVAGPAAALLVFSTLERGPATAGLYAAVPAAGLAAIAMGAALPAIARAQRANLGRARPGPGRVGRPTP